MRNHKLTIIIFCILLAGGSMLSAFSPKRDHSEIENRALASRPQLSIDAVLDGSYQEEYEAYLNDQFFLRDSWVSIAVNLERCFGKKDINGVYIGKNGYLIEKYSKEDFDAEQIRENIEFLSRFLNHATNSYGTEHVSCMLVPSKSAVLSDKLPAFAQAADETPLVTQLKEALDAPEIVLDATDELRKHQQEYIYYRTDHHWTTLGAYYAYAAWAKSKGKTPFSPEDYKQEAVFHDFYGTAYNKVHIPVPADTVTLFHSPEKTDIKLSENGRPLSGSKENPLYFREEAARGFNRYNIFFSKNTGIFEIDTSAKTDRTLLVIKDSFANCFVPFLVQDYQKIIMVDYRYTKKPAADIIDTYGVTDILVMYNTEKFMQDTNLRPLAKEMKSKTMEEFSADDFFAGLEDE